MNFFIGHDGAGGLVGASVDAAAPVGVGDIAGKGESDGVAVDIVVVILGVGSAMFTTSFPAMDSDLHAEQ